MENKDISQIVLEKIKEENIKPVSKKIFSLKKFLFWFFVTASLIVGSVVFAIIISLLIDNDWNLFGKFGFNFIFKTLPYFWFVCLSIFVVLGEYYYRKTLLGHRRSILNIIGIYIIATLFFGMIFSTFGLGETVEDSLYKSVPVYRGVIFSREDLWTEPDLGLLSGRVVFIDDNYINVIDNNGLTWTINLDGSGIDMSSIMANQKIKIVGEKVGDAIFQAVQIRPWDGMRQFNNHISK